jgi:hypothetical protein
MNRSKYLALAVLLLLQAGDLLTTWVGIHSRGLQEAGGTSFGTLLALKLVVTAVCALLCWRTKAALAWVVAGVMAAVYVPIIAHNARLIWG